ncbi:unnamed protein product [Darwinula stevensoni]|uniref:Ionotropic glutamate receptor L-glutamate and glycine-binding domain-containing protein n=1 Tax=Darwinula stevensoni TaxID=69355 RepID=A0A7R9ACM8_9CRUS|nr:unnamed protein product [Darwinula stevensoni]CAG0900516.1 unnamed protein product [Darwinula stevensoni]
MSVCGGRDRKKESRKRAFRFEVESRRWVRLGEMRHDSCLHVVGGTPNGNEHERLDLRTSRWEQLAELPRLRWNHALSSLKDELVLAGGYCDQVGETCFVYDRRSNSWREGPSMLFLISEGEDQDVVGRVSQSLTIFRSVEEIMMIKLAISKNDYFIALGSMEWTDEVLRALYRIRPQMRWTSKTLFVVRGSSRGRLRLFQRLNLENLFPDLLDDFQGKNIKVSAAHVPFFFNWAANGTMEDWTGFEGAALKAMAHHFNFRVIPTPEAKGHPRDTMITLFSSLIVFASLCIGEAKLELRIGRDMKDDVISQLIHRILDFSLESHQQLFLISEREDSDVLVSRDGLSRTTFSSVEDMERIKSASSRNDFYIILGSMEWAEEALRALYRIRPQMWWTSKALFVLEARPGVDWIQKAAGLMIPVTVARRIRPDMYGFYAVCLFCNGSHPGMQFIQTWRPGSKDISKNLFPDLLDDFHGKVFTVTSTPVRNFFNWSPGDTMKNWTGFEGEALKAMAHHFNFRVIPTLQKTGGTGNLVNGTWDGQIRMVLDGDAEFAVGKVSQTSIRYEYVDFMRFVMIETDSFITRKPQLLPYYTTVYRPFPVPIWILCGISIVVMGITLALFKRRSFKGLQVGNEIFNAYSIFVVKGVERLDREPERMRYIWTFWLVFCLFVSLMYNSLISSYIIYPGTTRPINTLEDAVQMTNLPFQIVLYNDVLVNTFRGSKNPTYQKVASRLKLVYPNNVVINLDSMFVDLRFQLELLIWRQRKANDPVWTELRLADENFLALPSAWPIRKYQPYKPKLDLFIQHLHDGGLFNKWMSDCVFSLGGYFPLKDVIDTPAEVDRISFGIVHVQGIFYALLFGLTLSVFAFILELLCSPKNREMVGRH